MTQASAASTAQPSPAPRPPSSLVSGEVNNTTLVMGPTGSGKSSLLATLAEHAFLTYGAITFLYSSDGGGYPDRVAALIRRGIIRVFRLRTRNGGDDSLALETTIKASKGWWPARIHPETGVTDPNVPMVPPVVQTPEGWRPNKGFPERRVVCYDGLSSLSTWWEHDLQARAGRLEITGGEKGGGIGVIVSGTERFSGGSRSQIGFSQGRAYQTVMNAQGIPNLVLPPVFTALTNEASDEALLRICGPKLSGQAKTDEAPAWFGNCLESRRLVDVSSGQYVYRLYLAEFIENNIRHLCKNRAEAGVLPLYLQDPAPEVDEQGHARYPGAFSQFSLGQFFALMEAAHERALKRLAEDDRFKAAPGLATIDYGELGASRSAVAVPAMPAAAGAVPAPTPAAPVIRQAPAPAATPAARPTVPTPVTPAPTPGAPPVSPAARKPPTMASVPPAPPPPRGAAKAPAVQTIHPPGHRPASTTTKE